MKLISRDTRALPTSASIFIFLIAASMGLGSSLAHAATKTITYDSTFRRIALECALERYVFGFETRGLSRGFEDDEATLGSPTLWMAQPGGGPRMTNPRLAIGPEGDGSLPELSFFAPPPVGGLCPGVFAFKLPSPEPGKPLVAILLRENARPYSDQLSVLVYDPVRHSLAKLDRKIGMFDDLDEKFDDGIEFRRAAERTKPESGSLKFDQRTTLTWTLEPIRPYVRWRWKNTTSEISEDLEKTWKAWSEALPFVNVYQFKPLTFWDQKIARMKATTFAVARNAEGKAVCVQALGPQAKVDTDLDRWLCSSKPKPLDTTQPKAQ